MAITTVTGLLLCWTIYPPPFSFPTIHYPSSSPPPPSQVGFVQLMRSHPKAVVAHRDLVLLCLADLDETIRLRSLELLTGMVTKRNLEELIHKLLR